MKPDVCSCCKRLKRGASLRDIFLYAADLIRERGFTSQEPEVPTYGAWTGALTALSALGTAWEEAGMPPGRSEWQTFEAHGGRASSSRDETLRIFEEVAAGLA